MNKYLACTAFLLPLSMMAQASAQTAATGMSPAAHPTMAPATSPMATSSMAPAASAANLSALDKKFAMKAAQGGMAEVQLAQLAQQKSQDATVKQYAQQMIDDHTPANQKLATIASTKGLTPPTAIDAMDQKMMTKLQGMDGKKFDTAYLKGQVQAHEVMLKLFQDESKNGTDADLKMFADQTVPTVQKHITMAQSGKSSAM